MMGTHAHFAGEFGSVRKPGMAKDPAYRAARAKHYAGKAAEANKAHYEALKNGDKTEAKKHALVATVSAQKAAKHADAAIKMDPNGSHAQVAEAAKIKAEQDHGDVKERIDRMKSGARVEQPSRVAVSKERRANAMIRDDEQLSAKTTFEQIHKSSSPADHQTISRDSGFMSSVDKTAKADAATKNAVKKNTYEAHSDAAAAHAEAADAARAAGRMDADRHDASVRGHMDAASKVAAASGAAHANAIAMKTKPMISGSGSPNSPQVLSQKAKQLSAIAKVSPTAANHAAAAEAHTKAATRNMAHEYRAQADNHREQVKHHEAEAAKIVAGQSQHVNTAQSNDHELGELVHKVAARIHPDGKFGGDSFIGDVHAHMGEGEKAKFGGTLQNFKQHLVRLNQGGHVTLKRADAQGDIDEMHPGKINRSEIEDKGATFHFVRAKR